MGNVLSVCKSCTTRQQSNELKAKPEITTITSTTTYTTIAPAPSAFVPPSPTTTPDPPIYSLYCASTPPSPVYCTHTTTTTTTTVTTYLNNNSNSNNNNSIQEPLANNNGNGQSKEPSCSHCGCKLCDSDTFTKFLENSGPYDPARSQSPRFRVRNEGEWKEKGKYTGSERWMYWTRLF